MDARPTGAARRAFCPTRWFLLTAMAGLIAAALLHAYAAFAWQGDVAAVHPAAELDAQGRLDALEIRKQTLPVHGPPYAPTSAEALQPIDDNAHQRRIQTTFRDEPSGLSITADTHLCLPGIDPCVSGGQIAVSDGTAEWKISFQLLGSENPSGFQSHLPKSRALLKRLQVLATNAEPPQQPDYYAALEDALAADADSPEQQTRVLRLLRLLLASYFAAEEYADTSAFAERFKLLQ